MQIFYVIEYFPLYILFYNNKREALTPLVKYFIIRSFFILPSCQNRHRTSSFGQFLFYRPVGTVTGLHRSVSFYFTVLSEPSQDFIFDEEEHLCSYIHSSIKINKFQPASNLYYNIEVIFF